MQSKCQTAISPSLMRLNVNVNHYYSLSCVSCTTGSMVWMTDSGICLKIASTFISWYWWFKRYLWLAKRRWVPGRACQSIEVVTSRKWWYFELNSRWSVTVTVWDMYCFAEAWVSFSISHALSYLTLHFCQPCQTQNRSGSFPPTGKCSMASFVPHSA